MHGTKGLKDLNELSHFRIPGKSVEKIQFLLKCDKNNVYFISGSMYIYRNISWVIFRMSSISGVILNKIKTRILCSVSSPHLQIYVFYEIMRNNMVASYRWQYSAAQKICDFHSE